MSDVTVKPIDPQDLLLRIRTDILQLPAVNEPQWAGAPGSMNSVLLQERLTALMGYYSEMEHSFQIFDTPIQSARPVLGKFVILIKRFIRKSIFWFLRPYWNQQVAYNRATLLAVSEIIKIQEYMLAAKRSEMG